MVFRELETSTLTTGGALTAIYNFLQGDAIHTILAVLLTLSIIILNIYKIRKYIRDEKDK
tara:strand:- start:95 stop:274 length:180 start_codon:yes stop_codon:yes gene_type:complete